MLFMSCYEMLFMAGPCDASLLKELACPTHSGRSLSRFRGHPNICVQGAHDGEDETTLHT
jgi:hypothetical protein